MRSSHVPTVLFDLAVAGEQPQLVDYYAMLRLEPPTIAEIIFFYSFVFMR